MTKATTDGVVVAGTVRGAVDVAGRRLDAAGAADGLVAYFDRAGAVRATVLVGGVGGGVDGVEAFGERSGVGVIDRLPQRGDVQLREMELHGGFLSLRCRSENEGT